MVRILSAFRDWRFCFFFCAGGFYGFAGGLFPASVWALYHRHWYAGALALILASVFLVLARGCDSLARER